MYKEKLLAFILVLFLAETCYGITYSFYPIDLKQKAREDVSVRTDSVYIYDMNDTYLVGSINLNLGGRYYKTEAFAYNYRTDSFDFVTDQFTIFKGIAPTENYVIADGKYIYDLDTHQTLKTLPERDGWYNLYWQDLTDDMGAVAIGSRYNNHKAFYLLPGEDDVRQFAPANWTDDDWHWVGLNNDMIASAYLGTDHILYDLNNDSLIDSLSSGVYAQLNSDYAIVNDGYGTGQLHLYNLDTGAIDTTLEYPGNNVLGTFGKYISEDGVIYGYERYWESHGWGYVYNYEKPFLAYPQSSSTATVPEPCTFILLLLSSALIYAVGIRRR